MEHRDLNMLGKEKDPAKETKKKWYMSYIANQKSDFTEAKGECNVEKIRNRIITL